MYYSVIIKDLMRDWKNDAHIKQIILYDVKRQPNEFDDSEFILSIYTNRPGPMIGRSGQLVDKYRQLISEKIKHKVFIRMIETTEIV